MRNLIYVLLLFPAFSFGQTKSRIDDKIILGTIDTVNSHVLKEKREVLVYTPNTGTKNSNNSTRYPVIYLLDGYDFFYSVTGMAQYLSAIGKMPEMIVVAIVNTNRQRDLTPTHSIFWSNGEKDSAGLKSTGGGENFISFIQKELIPYIDTHYNTESYRMFVGHSLGGLTVLNTLISHPELFNSYVAIDPTLWWDNQMLLKKAATALQQNDYKGKSLFFATANTLDKGMDTVRLFSDTSGSFHIRANFKFRNLLTQSKQSNMQCSWKYYSEDNHASVPMIATYDAFRSFFKNYELPKDLNDTSINATLIKTHYQNVSGTLGYKVLPPQGTINHLGYNFLAAKMYDKAHSFFKMNTDNYPASANAYDSMADFYVETNNEKKAIEAFKKALSLKEVPDTRKKLEKLQAKK